MSAPCVVQLDVNPKEGLTIVRHGRMSFCGDPAGAETIAGEHLAIALGTSIMDAAVAVLRDNEVTPWVHVRVDLGDVEAGSFCIQLVLPMVSERVEELVEAAVRRAPILSLLAPATPVSIATMVSGSAGLVA